MADNLETIEVSKPQHKPHHDHHDHHDHHCHHHNYLLDYYSLGPWFWEHPHHHECHASWPYQEHYWGHPDHPNIMPPIAQYDSNLPCTNDACIPHKDIHFLDKDNFLNEFASETDKMKAREALGIRQQHIGPFDIVRLNDRDNYIFKGSISYNAQKPEEPQEMWTKVATVIGSGILSIAYIYSNAKIENNRRVNQTKVYTNIIHAEEDGKIYIEKDDEHVRVINNDIYVKDATCFAEGYIQPIFNVGGLKVLVYNLPQECCGHHCCSCDCSTTCPHKLIRITTDKIVELGITQLWVGEAGTKAANTIKQKDIEDKFNKDGIADLDILKDTKLTNFLTKIFAI